MFPSGRSPGPPVLRNIPLYMKSFFKIFFASFLALVLFTLLGFFILVGFLSGLTKSRNILIHPNSVLVIDLTRPILELPRQNPLNAITREGPTSTPGLYDILGQIHQAARDPDIRGIYLEMGADPNGFATNEELRNAILRFKRSRKFVYAYGDDANQKAYYVASAADQVFLNPHGYLDFRGLSVQIMFLKGTLDRLEIEPQIFYDGKFKSATEPLRVSSMTEPNKVQTSAFLGDIYHHFLDRIGSSRGINPDSLATYADQDRIQNARDARRWKLVDGLKYDDQMMGFLKSSMALGSDERLNLVSLEDYANRRILSASHLNRVTPAYIAIIDAQGDIVDGSTGNRSIAIGGEDYVKLIRQIRQNHNIKAIVFRVNSPGGSALAAEDIWRELSLAKKEKPVVVSMGDYAASGGYYISACADSIFAQPNTLTGSIGVFSIVPNLQRFFKDKLGITFDGVKTSQFADMGTMARPLTDAEKRIFQNMTDRIYETFKERVSQGRHLSPAEVDSIAQGRVWSGTAACRIGLVDRIGGIGAAIRSAASLAHLSKYSIRQYPAPVNPLMQILGDMNDQSRLEKVESSLGDKYRIWEQVMSLKKSFGKAQARLPYQLDIE